MRPPRILTFLIASTAFIACGSDDGTAPKADTAVKIPDAGASPDAPMAATDTKLPSLADGGDVGPPVMDAPVVDAPAVDAPVVDVPEMDAPTGVDAAVAFAKVGAILKSYCVSCHNGMGTASRILDLSDKPDAGSTLLERLLGPLPLEAFCGATDAGVDASAWAAIVPGDPEQSLLYLKVTGTQPSPGAPPTNCGLRMPRVEIPAVGDAGVTSVACDKAPGGAAQNCVSPAEVEILREWILQGALP